VRRFRAKRATHCYRVEAALTSLADRIRSANDDQGAGFTVDEAVVFGDILFDKARAQAVNVGIRLTPHKDESQGAAAKHVAGFLKELRGKSALLHLERIRQVVRQLPSGKPPRCRTIG
jgi:hypothetical protein